MTVNRYVYRHAKTHKSATMPESFAEKFEDLKKVDEPAKPAKGKRGRPKKEASEESATVVVNDDSAPQVESLDDTTIEDSSKEGNN